MRQHERHGDRDVMSGEPAATGSDRRLTTHGYWDAGYERSVEQSRPLDVGDFRHRADARLADVLAGLAVGARQVLEVGAGNSAMLCHLSRQHSPGASFSGLDYSEAGCSLLRTRAAIEGAQVEVLHQDLFKPSAELLGRFDLVYSIGVVEHFTILAEALEAKARLAAPGGRLFTLIPNMHGVPGALVRRFNRTVYDLHIAHDLPSFIRGHHDAGLEVESAGYLCSVNFGLLSACFTSPRDRGFTTYLWLSRLTKLTWLIESLVGEFPRTATFSPYLVATSRRPA